MRTAARLTALALTGTLAGALGTFWLVLAGHETEMRRWGRELQREVDELVDAHRKTRP